MASSYDPTANVSPSLSAPNDYITTKATPATFGGEAAQALESGGQKIQQGFDKVSDTLLQQKGALNELIATKAEADLAEVHGKIISEYHSKEGLDAVAAQDAYVKQLKDAQVKIQSTMPNLQAQRAFATLTARSTSYAIRDMGDYAATQFKTAQKRSTASGLDLAVSSLGDPSVANDPSRALDAQQSIKFFAVKSLQDDGMLPVGPDGNPSVDKDGNIAFSDSPRDKQAKVIYDDTIKNATGKGYVNQFRTLLNDPQIGADKAWSVFQTEREKIPPEATAQILAMIRPRVIDDQTRDIAHRAVYGADQDYSNSTGQALSGSSTSDQIFNSIYKQESNSGKNSVTSIDGARGPGQIRPSTFVDFAKPGESIDNPKDNVAVSKRIIEKYTEDYKGDPQRVAVAYFSGPNNVSPPGSSTPWLKDTHDGNGKSVSSYVSDVTSRTRSPATNENGGYLSKADYYRTHLVEIIAGARKEAEDRGLEPSAVDQTEARVKQQAMNLISQQDLSDRADVDTVQQALLGHFNNGVPLISQEQLEGGPPQVQQAWNNLKMRDTFAMQNVLTRWLPNNLAREKAGYGEDFYSVYQKAANGEVQNPLKDLPVGNNFTYSGAKALTNLMSSRSDDNSHVFWKQEAAFFKALHDDAYGYKLHPGVSLPKFESDMGKQMQFMIPIIEKKRSEGMTPGQLFQATLPNGKANPDYVGQYFHAPHVTDVRTEWRSYTHSHIGDIGATKKEDFSSIKTQADVEGLIRAGKLPRDPKVIQKFLVDHGISQEAPPSSPAPSQ